METTEINNQISCLCMNNAFVYSAMCFEFIFQKSLDFKYSRFK